MREILFRGKRIDNGGWVEGIAIFADNKAFILNNARVEYVKGFNENRLNFVLQEVIPETIGQYTGLTDKNGKKVFEGDIVLYERDEEYGQIAYHENEAMFVVQFDTWLTNFDHMYGKNLEVIGNIHDNPELLKGSEQE